MKNFLNALLIIIAVCFIFFIGWDCSTRFHNYTYDRGYYHRDINNPEWKEVPMDSVTMYILNNPTIRVWDSIAEKSRYYRIGIK